MSWFFRNIATADNVFAVFLGALASACLYLFLAVSGRSLLSVYVMDYAFGLAFLSTVAAAIALNLGRVSAVAILSTLVIIPLLLFALFVISLAPAFSDWVQPDEVGHLLLFVFLPILGPAIRRPQRLPLMLAAAVASLAVLVVALQFVVRWALEAQVAGVQSQGGCVIAGFDNSIEQTLRKIESADQIRRGWFIGADIEPVYLVFDDHYLVWTFSRLDVQRGRGGPEHYPLRGKIRC